MPPQFAYLRPYATTEVELDFEKLNPLLTDQAVNAIESNGPDQAVIVKGSMGIKPTNVILSKEEIDQIIQTFFKKIKNSSKRGSCKNCIRQICFISNYFRRIWFKIYYHKTSSNSQFWDAEEII